MGPVVVAECEADSVLHEAAAGAVPLEVDGAVHEADSAADSTRDTTKVGHQAGVVAVDGEVLPEVAVGVVPQEAVEVQEAAEDVEALEAVAADEAVLVAVDVVDHNHTRLSVFFYFSKFSFVKLLSIYIKQYPVL